MRPKRDERSEESISPGAPSIHGELLKLGIDVSETAESKYLVRDGKPPSQTWRTFLENHSKDIIAADFFTVPTATFHVLFVLVVLSHDRRVILHTNNILPSGRFR